MEKILVRKEGRVFLGGDVDGLFVNLLYGRCTQQGNPELQYVED